MKQGSLSPGDFRMPAEWEPHTATWIAWPCYEDDFPGKVETVQWVYVEIVRLLMAGERVEILCHDENVLKTAQAQFERSNICGNFRFHVRPYDRGWLRDSMPTGVISAAGAKEWIQWKFTAWEFFSNYALDAEIPAFASNLTKRPIHQALRPDNSAPLVLEGGAFDTDGDGTLLVTEECLLSDVQERNRGLSRAGYEQAFSQYLGSSKVIWLNMGCEGDTTHGHVDDIARFIAPAKIALAVERNHRDPNHETSIENLNRLKNATDAKGRKLEVVELPFPHLMEMDGKRLPGSYANFYIGNKVVIVPTFNDVNDRIALSILQTHFPDREVVGIHSVDLVLGEGTLHCLTQQEPA